MYAKCGSMEDACRVFNKSRSCDVVTLNVMIFGLVKCGRGTRHLPQDCFDRCNRKVCDQLPSFVGVLNAFASIVALDEGRHVHEQIIESGRDPNAFVVSSLVDMYAKCRSMEMQRVFNRMPSRDAVAWTWHPWAW